MINPKSRVHFVGIGGIGMSSIAAYMCANGFMVSGSDKVETGDILEKLRNLGVEIFHKHSTANITTEIDLVIRSSAIRSDNEEISRAKELGIQVINRAQALKEILIGKKVAAVTGTHGKTTTTSLLGYICIKSLKDPTIFVGGIMKDLNSNLHIGHGEIAVVEADESDGSFLITGHSLGLVTNMEMDHVEYYETHDKLLEEYKKFVNLGENTLLCTDDPGLRNFYEEYRDVKDKLYSYGVYGKNNDISALNIRLLEHESVFDIVFGDDFAMSLGAKVLKDVRLSLLGLHNIQNALGALLASILLGCELNLALDALKNFKGVERRFCKIGKLNGATVLDDYAHHPTEIDSVLKVASKIKGDGRLIVIFEPHKYTRLSRFMSEFATVLSSNYVDSLVLTGVYSSGEDPINGVDSEHLRDKISTLCRTNTSVVRDFEELKQLILREASPGDTILALGAGALSNFIRSIVEIL
ncbi:UDP-N-acetylmuramate--L-alanine ligase [Candidatus Cyrtobacter comes]|uniref:UDP-N-acetylmuramate--L-alanine ligase n=1 Tax=Candidatus Cyrtobacter comes TaxID=675776 RepID=A0ABU5L8Q4_9RICK|nr:UDP-N-acetylmuramate--L-alanine ligase [Candidatus Cyrtobacter comes]MDZ5762499.1 UDP-N-acetylmuramate--L-alanine ligase [Candidatus Cyrtobacter comes]